MNLHLTKGNLLHILNYNFIMHLSSYAFENNALFPYALFPYAYENNAFGFDAYKQNAYEGSVE